MDPWTFTIATLAVYRAVRLAVTDSIFAGPRNRLHQWLEPVVEITDGTAGHSGVLLLRTRAIADLPASPVAGMTATVSDATTPTIGSTVSGGGSAFAQVVYNGSAWTVTGK